MWKERLNNQDIAKKSEEKEEEGKRREENSENYFCFNQFLSYWLLAKEENARNMMFNICCLFFLEKL